MANEESISSESLEGKVKREPTPTYAEKIIHNLYGLSGPVLGGLTGYWVTGGPGGAGLGMALSSLGMGALTENRRFASYINTVGFFVGSAATLISVVYHGAKI